MQSDAEELPVTFTYLPAPQEM
eukprot:COSAG06_NODE_68352_length_230_cov_9.778626_1_plen_21_part_10